MKKKLGLLLATLMVLNTVSTAVFAIESPLKKYSLYDDVFAVPPPADDGTGRERAMGEYYDNSLGKKLHEGGNGKQVNPDSPDYVSPEIPSLKDFKPQPVYEKASNRNETLRESSRNVYSDPTTTPSWMEGPIFYAEPTLESIIAKYRKSDFAGCLQECEAYVRKYPYDTLGFYYLAMAYTKCSKKDEAIRAYEKVISLHDNPMIVKYATNGRNCIMDNGEEECFQNVNEPELIYPYAHLANYTFQPVDPQKLIDRNLAQLRLRMSPVDENGNPIEEPEAEEGENKISLPFGKQDASLDAFINAPYGNGLSPEVNQQYQQLQLKKLQQTINMSEEDSDPQQKQRELNDIKRFDNHKTDSETIKLAYEPSAIDFKSIEKDPEFIKQKQELEELNMLLGNDRKNDSSDITNLLPYMTEGEQKVSPEVIRDMMMQSMMESISI
ncbi:tetratricopeptide repeat protein [bacterium]|nr:tetratricopeptide repeat protein [bacterium]